MTTGESPDDLRLYAAGVQLMDQVLLQMGINATATRVLLGTSHGDRAVRTVTLVDIVAVDGCAEIHGNMSIDNGNGSGLPMATSVSTPKCGAKCVYVSLVDSDSDHDMQSRPQFTQTRRPLRLVAQGVAPLPRAKGCFTPNHGHDARAALDSRTCRRARPYAPPPLRPVARGQL